MSAAAPVLAPPGSAAPAAAASLQVPPHVQTYLAEVLARTRRIPEVVRRPEEARAEDLDAVYPVGAPYWIHVHRGAGGEARYVPVEPPLGEEEAVAVARLRDALFDQAMREPPPSSPEALAAAIERLVGKASRQGHMELTPEALTRVRQRILRELVSYGPLDPVMRDPNVEDLQGVGRLGLFVVHRHFGMMRLDPLFRDDEQFEAFLRNLSERVGRPVSEGRPIVDASLPDGSRINIVFSESVSKRGPSFSVRRVSDDPASIVRLVRWGTLSAEMAAYLWLCIENGMSVFVCGESACGKTTTLNALMGLIPPKHKVYTAEDTAEVTPPHKVWQRLLTRETGPEAARVGMFDLLKAALRSRPNYIIVGEIRGAEGNVAFQAMQTGHPVIASFHASNVRKMLQRLTSEPINVPVTFIDNLNVGVFQQAVYVNGRVLRRITGIEEIEGFSPLDGGTVTRPVFTWDRANDQHRMKGKYNSYILERKIGEKLGDADPRAIYGELAVRTRILERMLELGVEDHQKVHEVLSAYMNGGSAALPFAV